MANLDIHFDALDDCRTAAKKIAGKFGDLAETYPAQTTDSSMFGRLTSSSELATLVDGIEKTVDSEMGDVQNKLKGVERALSTVEENLRSVKYPSVNGS
ncbi:hypothetical protein SAMN05216275_1892 [Streptosporangium canum]|uniref:Excreted virulence factor EspC, type VII ESX diderm n=1 Tax=Streptosporangium canum TaxID=324952 RepID=A0A1I4G402_9ACTN|nr:hypothetical protein [Streptosporangium canum]SFL23791.1 hypothetical protein SAMN05216275_1892 [Streptosporangium canum]